MILAFLDAHRFADHSVRGAVLVTDERTRPLEFRVTEPIAPDVLQQMLFGAVLDEHLLGDLCGVPLLDALREEPSYVLVRDQALLSLQAVRDERILWVGRDDGDQSGGVVLGQHGASDAEVLDRARRDLRLVAEHYDLLEPFERLTAAVGHLHAQGIGAAT
jgi:hypothetical protein